MSWVAVFLALQTVWVVPTPHPVKPGPTPVAQAPAAVVDRIVERPGERTRISLFSNGVAVVAIHYGNAKPVLFKRTLTEKNLVAYLVALQNAAKQIRALYAIPDEHGVGEGTITIRLAAGPGKPIRLRFPIMAMMPMAIGRLGTVLDDLQAKVMATPSGYDEVTAWKPREGDVVEMITGQKAEVIEVRDDGTIIVEYETVAVTELVTKAERANRIRRVLSRATR